MGRIMEKNNYAFIDSQNVNLGIRKQGWKLDFSKFRVYLNEKYGVSRAYLFIGYIPGNNNLYIALQRAGFICVFKPTIIRDDGSVKGNCDAELVLQAMTDYPLYNKALIATGDGDFFCLVNHLFKNGRLGALFIPKRSEFSALLKMKEFAPYVRYMEDLKEKLCHKKEGPRKDGTLKG